MNITCVPYRARIESHVDFNKIDWSAVQIFLETDASYIFVSANGKISRVEWTRTQDCDPVVVANVFGSAYYDVDRDMTVWEREL